MCTNQTHQQRATALAALGAVCAAAASSAGQVSWLLTIVAVLFIAASIAQLTLARRNGSAR